MNAMKRRAPLARFLGRSAWLGATAGAAGLFTILMSQRATAANPRTGDEPASSAAVVSADARGAVPDDLEDGAITARVKSRLALDDTIRSRDIHVATKDAVVTLTGQVASEAERDRAVKLARETEGVKSVTDRLETRK